MTGLALACGGSSALNHVMDADIDKLMGERTAARPVASGRVAAPRALEFGVVLMALSVCPPRDDGERAHRGAGAGRRALLRRRLHGLSQALDRSEHRHRRRCRSRAAARRLRRREREPHPAGALAVPDRLPLDAAALLGARADDQGALRRREHPDAARHQGRPGDDAADPALLDRDGRVHGCGRLVARTGLHRRRSAPRRVFLLLAWQLRRDTSRRRAFMLFHYSLAYLALLFVAAAIDPLLV